MPHWRGTLHSPPKRPLSNISEFSLHFIENQQVRDTQLILSTQVEVHLTEDGSQTSQKRTVAERDLDTSVVL